MGKAEDTESGLLARCRDLSTFQEFAGKLCQSLKMAWSSQRFWQQFEMHIDSMRRRPLEEPWASPWTLRESASMLVRNRTKVPLRVELHHPPKEPSPFSECLQPLFRNCWVAPDPLLVAEVNPGIEWALRPKKEDGRDFQVKILTFAGVEVCARPLKRGDSYDFHVAVPAKPAQKDSDALSCSTAARRLSLASTASSWSSWSSANPSAPREVSSEGRARVGDIDGFTTCLCPQCLQRMPLQWERPTEEIYSEGVPGTGVQPHSDGRNFFLTAHFGLSVPPDCAITVGGEERPWKEDDCIILDTSFMHSTRNDSDEDRFVLVVDFWHPDLTIPEREALEWIYDFRNKFEQGKIKYVPKLPDGFWETLYVYSAWGGAYTEENVLKEPIGPDTLGGFKLGSF
eukprot:s125_g2.t5